MHRSAGFTTSRNGICDSDGGDRATVAGGFDPAVALFNLFRVDVVCESFFRGFHPGLFYWTPSGHKRLNKNQANKSDVVSICSLRFLLCSISRCRITDQFRRQRGIEIGGTIACWASINQNSYSRHGLGTPFREMSPNASDRISPGGKKLRLSVQPLGQ